MFLERKYAAKSGIPPTTYRSRGFLPCGVGEKLNFIEIQEKFNGFEDISDIDAVLQEEMKESDLKQVKSITYALKE